MGCGASTAAAAQGASGPVGPNRVRLAPDQKPVVEECQVFQPEDDHPIGNKDVSRRSFNNEIEEVNRLLNLPSDKLQDALVLPTVPAEKSRTEVQEFSISNSSSEFTGVVAQVSPEVSCKAMVQKEASARSANQASSNAAIPIDPNDPWQSMQNQYQLGEDDLMSKPGQEGSLESLHTSGRMRPSANNNNSDVILMDDNEGLKPVPPKPRGMFGGLGATSGRPKLPPIQGGGWDKGTMAKAGDLMLGDEDEQLKFASSNYTADARAAQYNNSAGEDHVPANAKARSKVVDDLGMEDIDDVDAMLEEEMQNQGLNKDLAAKLRAFEAANDDDY